MKYKILIGMLTFFASFAVYSSETSKVLALAGSTRKDSYNKKLLLEAVAIARQMGATVTIFDLKENSIPFYDGDLEAEGSPENATRLRELMASSDAIFISCPEYNGSMPGVLKNALDWASRKKGEPTREAFSGKPFLIISGSPGRGGGSQALSHLRAVVERVGGSIVADPISVPQVHTVFNAEGSLQNDTYKNQLQKTVRQALKK